MGGLNKTPYKEGQPVAATNWLVAAWRRKYTTINKINQHSCSNWIMTVTDSSTCMEKKYFTSTIHRWNCLGFLQQSYYWIISNIITTYKEADKKVNAFPPRSSSVCHFDLVLLLDCVGACSSLSSFLNVSPCTNFLFVCVVPNSVYWVPLLLTSFRMCCGTFHLWRCCVLWYHTNSLWKSSKKDTLFSIFWGRCARQTPKIAAKLLFHRRSKDLSY